MTTVAYSHAAQQARAYVRDEENLGAARSDRAALESQVAVLIRKYRPAHATDGDVAIAVEQACEAVALYFADTINALERACDPWGGA